MGTLRLQQLEGSLLTCASSTQLLPWVQGTLGTAGAAVGSSLSQESLVVLLLLVWLADPLQQRQFLLDKRIPADPV